VCLPVQQRLVPAARLLAAWQAETRSPRRSLLDAVIRDVCDGAHSLGELDLGAWCRRYGLPPPLRQQVVTTAGGRAHLDAQWDDLVVEVDGVQHTVGLAPVDDALRSNEVVLRHGSRVLRMPVMGLRTHLDAFMAQLAQALGAVHLQRGHAEGG
jgi:hypothetical protein